ncbi:MAG: LPS-assembly protein LptD [Coxiella endosymbiont of Dermacentor silvarum]
MKLKNLFIFIFVILTLLFFQLLCVALTTSKAIKTSLSKRHFVSEILPKGWSHYLFHKHIANILGWIPIEESCLFCHGYFKKPLVVTRLNHIINADKAYIYWDNKTDRVKRIILVGRVHLHESGKLIVADRGKLTRYPKTATFKNVAYLIYNNKSDIPRFHDPVNAWGTAQYAIRDISQVITLRHATYSTCDPTNPIWRLSATTLVLNKQKHRGEAYNTILWFYDFPVFYFPYYNFPIDHYRKTGFLTPRLGLNDSSNGLFSFPFYWNMAPNYDLTLAPEFMIKRGFNINALFRFLSIRSSDNMYLSYLPNDTVFQQFREETLSKFSNPVYTNNPLYTSYLNQLKNMKNQRSFFSINEHTIFNSKWSLNVMLNYVTDPYFLRDLGAQMNLNALSNQLLSQVDLQYSGLHWQFNSTLRAYQTLHLISQIFEPAFDQYARLPDFNIDGYYPDIALHMDFNLNAEATNFNYQSDFASEKPTGQRFHIRSGLSFPFYFASGYLIPQIWVDTTTYNIEHFQPHRVQTASRLLPIFNIDLCLYFDRDLYFWGYNLTQTLEPHFFYLYVPYQNQDKLPNFDTVLLPFTFEQLFTLNQYIGDDRLQNANQTSFGLISRIFNSITGSPLLTTNLGFIYSIEKKHVCLPAGCTPFNFHFSPIVGELIFYPFSHWSITSSIAWDPNLRQNDNASTEISYINGGQKVIMSYIFLHRHGQSIMNPTGIISQTGNCYNTNTNFAHLSVSWPLSARWSITGCWNHDITHHRTDITAFGVQYNTCCWTLSFITRHTYTGLTVDAVGSYKNGYDTTCVIQLDLKGLGNFGNPPIATQSLFN